MSRCYLTRGIVSLLCLVLVASTSLYAQPVTWPTNGHAYEVILPPGGLTWSAAQQAAANAGGHLVTVASHAD